MRLQLANHHLDLLPGRATFHVESASLVVADVHLGKSATFRQRGLPVPEGDTRDDLSALERLVTKYGPSQLIIAGDLVHSADGLSPDILTWLTEWLIHLPVPVILTEGNHDQRAWLEHHDLPLQIVSMLDLRGLIITHDPADLPPSLPGIAGHLHPGLKIPESRWRTLRVSGFHLQAPSHLILPAFSQFTGIHPIKRKPGDRFFTALRGEIVEIPDNL